LKKWRGVPEEVERKRDVASGVTQTLL
jgi:hypothetical protein